jgi:Pvc16 N-terminal domain
MIHNVMLGLAKDLNFFLKKRLDLQEDVVILSELMNLDGTVAVNSENCVICSLLNIEQDRTGINASFADNQVVQNRPLSLNLYLLFSAFYAPENYLEALKAISFTLVFFQGKQVFTPANTPHLDVSISRIVVDLVNIDLKDLSNFWTALGAKHLPSILFRVRMLTLSADMILDETPDIKTLDTATGSGI